MPKLEERELTAILAAEKRDALSADQAARLSEERERAMDYYNGDMKAVMPSSPDRSKAVSMDVFDTVEGLMPGLMEIFCSGDEVVRFNPAAEDDEELAAQETDYINNVFLQQNEGFIISYCFIKDALISKNGIVKIFWEEKEERDEETFYDQPDDVYALFAADPEIEIVAHTVNEAEAPPPLLAPPIGQTPSSDSGVGMPVGPGAAVDANVMPPPGPQMPGPGPEMQNPAIGQAPGMNGGMPPQTIPEVGDLSASGIYGPTHDFTIVTKRKYGCCRVENVPPEEFGVSRRAKLGQPLDYSFHQVQRTVADLIRQGFDEDQLEDLPDSPVDENTESIARDTVEDDKTFSSSVNRANRLVTVTEHYVMLDYEQDGHARLYRVTTAGGEDGHILKRDGKPDIIPVDFDPFASMTPIIMPHRFFGKGMADITSDIQNINTALYRGMLDNVYLANNQRIEISESHAGQNTIDDLLNNRPGGLVRTKQPGGLLPIPNQNLGEYVYPALEYMDTKREWRTGVVRQGQGIDADALQNQSATAVQQTFSASQAKQKLTARLLAEVGFRQMFWKIHATVRKNERNTPTIKLRGKWVTVNPREFKKRDDLTISVGLGSGGKAEQTAFWMAILGIQKEALALPGQNIVQPKNIYAVLQKLMAAGGEKSVEPYFTDPDEAPPSEAPEDPKMAEAQGKLQISQAELQGKMQLSQQQQQADMAEAQARITADREKMTAEFRLKQEMMAAEHRLKVEQMNAEFALRQRQMQVEAALERENMHLSAAVNRANGRDKAAMSAVKMGGRVG